MLKTFFERNWLYIILVILIVMLNVLPRVLEKSRVETKVFKAEDVKEVEDQSLFVDFNEAQRRNIEIEKTLKQNPPLYIFYLSLNLLLVVALFLGLFIDGYFIYASLRKINIFAQYNRQNSPPWGIGDIFRIIILAISASYAFFIVFGFGTSFFEVFSGIRFEFYKSENFRMVFDTIILDFFVLVVVFIFLRRAYGRNFSDIGFTKENMARNVFYGITGYIAVIPIIFAVGLVVYVILNILKLKPPPQPIVGLFLEEKNTALVAVSSIIASIFGPFIEEIFFRGVMYNALKRKIGIFGSILITSVLFSFLHTHAMTYFLVGFIPITILGVALAYLYEKTGSLIPSITLHIMNNLGSVIMVFIFKYFNSLVA